MKNRYSQVMDGLCIIIMLTTMIYLIMNWGQIGAESSGSMGIGRGGAASKQTLVILLGVTWFMFAGLTMAEQLPRLFSGQKQLKEDTRHILGELIKMVKALKLALVMLFSYLAVYSARIHELPEMLMPLILGVTVLILVLNLFRLRWMRGKA